MRQIVYYVASSIDGFIAGPKEDISGFVQGGNGVDQYLSDLQQFDTVIMGRRTYEFGYKYGIEPGQPAYPHMQHYIFSNTLHFDHPHEKLRVWPPDLKRIRELKESEGSDIYLCGGGIFAGWLLEHQLIDRLKIKLNPFIQGRGTPLFTDAKKLYQLQLIDHQQYDYGLQMISYRLKY